MLLLFLLQKFIVYDDQKDSGELAPEGMVDPGLDRGLFY